MNLIPWRNKSEQQISEDRPETSLTRLRDEIDHVFERVFHEPFSTRRGSALESIAQWPRIDLSESENEVVVTAEVPGIDPKDVDIHVSGNMLTIRGERRQEKEEEKRNYYYSERSFGQFQRFIPLPGSINPDRVDASYKNGTLTVSVAKRPEAKPKRVEVKEGS
jgi:HSP20 family protein